MVVSETNTFLPHQESNEIANIIDLFPLSWCGTLEKVALRPYEPSCSCLSITI